MRLNLIDVIMSDHGTDLWDRGQFGKSGSRLYSYNTQINLMIRHPDLAGRGRRCDAFVQNQDILPTLLHLLDIPCPQVDGENLWPLVVDGAPSVRDHAVVGLRLARAQTAQPGERWIGSNQV